MTRHPIVVALTGASGAPYGLRLLQVLAIHKVPVWLIPSSHGMRLLRDECGIDSMASLQAATGDWSSVTVFPDDDRGALPASGSQRTGGMVVTCPEVNSTPGPADLPRVWLIELCSITQRRRRVARGGLPRRHAGSHGGALPGVLPRPVERRPGDLRARIRQVRSEPCPAR